MIADSPRFVTGKKVKRGDPIETADDLRDFLI